MVIVEGYNNSKLEFLSSTQIRKVLANSSLVSRDTDLPFTKFCFVDIAHNFSLPLRALSLYFLCTEVGYEKERD